MYWTRIEKSNGDVVAAKAMVCDGVLSRCRGLLFRPDFPAGQGCWIKPCSSIHTFGMTFPIDVLVLDCNLKVIAKIEKMKPWRFSRIYWLAHSMLEFRSPLTVPCSIGDQLMVKEVAK
jgi:hypothetical protein